LRDGDATHLKKNKKNKTMVWSGVEPDGRRGDSIPCGLAAEAVAAVRRQVVDLGADRDDGVSVSGSVADWY